MDLAYVKKHKRNHFCRGKFLVNSKGNFDIVSLYPNSLGWHPPHPPQTPQVWTKCHKNHTTNWSFMSSIGRHANISHQSTKNVEIHLKYIRNLVTIIISSTWIHLTLSTAKKVVKTNFRGKILQQQRHLHIHLLNYAILGSLYRNDFVCVFWHELNPKVHII